MRAPSFIGGDYQSPSFSVDVERTINLFLERQESPGAAAPMVLFKVPGVAPIATAMGSPGRAHWSGNNREFAVEGVSFVEIDISGNVTTRGTVATDANPATICSNGDGGDQLFVTSGSNGYVYDLTANTLTQIAALNGKATQGDYLDGYGLVLDAATSTFYISALLDFSTWATGIDFAQRSDSPDPWLAMRVFGIYIALLGEQTSSFWFDAGTSSFPFAPHPSGRIPFGINAAFTLSVGEGSMFWLGRSSVGQRTVYRASGFTPEPVSTFPLQAEFQRYENVESAQGEIINWQGHTFYLLHFPAPTDITWCYDLSTGVWFQWGTWISEQNEYQAWRPRWHAMAFGEHRMLDSQTGSVYRLDASVHTDVDERPIRWLRRAPALSAENELIFYQSFELDVEPGVGLVNGQGEDPQVMMRQSRDGGKNWSSERWRTAGKVGAYLTRIRWEQCGSARKMVFEVAGSDPVPTAITGAFLGLGQTVKALQEAQAGARR